ncbi:12147_t:CDS:2, partial [Dentiscutata heterogama]
LPKTGYREEHQYPESPRLSPKSPTESDKSSIDSDASERKRRWMSSITERLRPLSPHRRMETNRSNTSSLASWHKNQKLYTPSVTNSENKDKEQEISQNIERAFNQNNQKNQENNSEPQQIQIQSTFKG